MNMFKRFLNIIIIVFVASIMMFLAYCDAMKGIKARQREQAILDYYESVETLLDSLCIDCGDTIFDTRVGTKYLNSKYAMDSLVINNDRGN